MTEKIVLKYIGNASMLEVPARDLTDRDLDNIAWTGWNKKNLVESGLYELAEQTKNRTKKQQESEE